MNKTVEITIKGLSPLLMHAYPLVKIDSLEKLAMEEQAEYAAYRDPVTKELYIPGVNFQRALVAGAAFSKGKGRASLQKPVAACVMVSPMRAGLGVTTYTISTMPVVIPATKGRVLRYRPMLEHWQADFTIDFDPLMITETQLRTVVDDTGSKVGLLDFRPERKGPYGRFMVTSWK